MSLCPYCTVKGVVLFYAGTANVLFYAGTADAGTMALALMLRRYHWLCYRQTFLEH